MGVGEEGGRGREKEREGKTFSQSLERLYFSLPAASLPRSWDVGNRASEMMEEGVRDVGEGDENVWVEMDYFFVYRLGFVTSISFPQSVIYVQFGNRQFISNPLFQFRSGSFDSLAAAASLR